MADVIRMPRMSDTMEEGNIVSWLKKVGEAVEAGEAIAEVETDKATMEVDSYFDGILLHIAVNEGAVPINGVIAVIGEEGEDWQAAIDAEDVPSSNGMAANDTSSEKSEPSPKIEAPATPVTNGGEGRIKASPLAKSMALAANIDISTIKGTGDNGRIIKRDIESAMNQPSTPTMAAAPKAIVEAPTPANQATVAKEEDSVVAPFVYNNGDANYDDTPVSQMRKVIARRLGESKFTAPHFYLTLEMDMSKAMKWRKKLNEVAATRISYNDLVIKACAAALRQHPAVNSSWMGDHIRTNHDINIGVAVAVADGLLVPVIRYADIKTLSQINIEVRTLAGKAKKRKLQPAEMQGNTFTISNLGMFGIEEFTAIINPPDACILAVGGIIEKPVVSKGKIKVGHTMKVTLSCDHRVVDGVTGSQFLLTLKEIMEDPIRLMV